MANALITGASAGLGLDFAELFAGDGHSLILVARRKDLLEAAATSLKAKNPRIQVTVIEQDLGLPGAGLNLFKRVTSLGLQVDYLVNNAGFGTAGDFSGIPLEQQLKMIDLNVRTLVELTHLFLPDMRRRKAGAILNVGSTAAFQAGPNMATYYASKAFVNSFSEALHEELKGSGVSCTVLVPGPTRTEFAKVSGADATALFKPGLAADSMGVARAGYRAMKRGRAMKIPGILNFIQVQMTRVSPRVLTRKIAGRLNSPG